MEVADQWRREWAGTAEFGKVTEGGVTRRIARAMEVLHASGPGARVRVMRAAYHSSAAPGTPAASFMLHSSRRVFSSGFNFLESPSSPIKPLEISSMPLESSPEPNTDTENYKVTEPDDFEISEPSKWRSSTRGSSIRMPSEESSSTDNASIIDLDSRLGRNLHRKYSYDSENSDIQVSSRNNSRNSPLLDTPVTLSTLKYKSLLNSSNEWNSRRKSYSFEDTSPINETIVHSNDTLAMESSTDSGICKSSEIVNDYMDDSAHTKSFSKPENNIVRNEESFKDWLSKNRPTSNYRGTKFKSHREHGTVVEDPVENNITVQSSGKVSITLPITLETDGEVYKNQAYEENERKVKKVEFCKTEVHFTADSGKVNIIATDEKPPSSNDFRKRRSAFVPLPHMAEKPITLFGERNDFSNIKETSTCLTVSHEFGESDESTAATKSILKNKIPKPKPYLLGENMGFGISDDISKIPYDDPVPSAVSLVNKQLEAEKHYNGEVKTMFSRESVKKPNMSRTYTTSPTDTSYRKQDKPVVTHIKIDRAPEEPVADVKNKNHLYEHSKQFKTRKLRDSDLTYFGVNKTENDIQKLKDTVKNKFECSNNVTDNLFHSVKLIQQVSNTNSVCNSEPESDESPEYQNIPLNINYAPVPTPRLRSKYDDKPYEINEITVLKPIIEKETKDVKEVVSSTRREKSRREGETITTRSLSAPPKAFRRSSTDRSYKREDNSTSSRNHHLNKDITSRPKERMLIEDEAPIYVNLNVESDVSKSAEHRALQKQKSNSLNSRNRRPCQREGNKSNEDRTPDSSSKVRKERKIESGTDDSVKTKRSINKDSLSRSIQKDSLLRGTEKGDKINSSDSRRKTHDEQRVSKHGHTGQEDKSANAHDTTEKKSHRSRSLQRSKVNEDSSKNKNHITVKTEHPVFKHRLDDSYDANNYRKRNSSRDNSSSAKGSLKPASRQDSSPIARNSWKPSKGAEKDVSKTSSHKSKRREYVINYDDKNGTVSSICKVKPSYGSPTRKRTSKDSNKDKDNKPLKYKTVEKTAPMQIEDHHEDRNGLSSGDRKWKTKVHVQRSCQVL